MHRSARMQAYAQGTRIPTKTIARPAISRACGIADNVMHAVMEWLYNTVSMIVWIHQLNEPHCMKPGAVADRAEGQQLEDEVYMHVVSSPVQPSIVCFISTLFAFTNTS